MTGSSSTLVEALKAKGIYQLPQSSRPASLPKKQDHILEFIQAVLDGREAPHSISRIGRLFGRNSSSMLSHPYWMMMPETRATWHATRHELGLEP